MKKTVIIFCLAACLCLSCDDGIKVEKPVTTNTTQAETTKVCPYCNGGIVGMNSPYAGDPFSATGLYYCKNCGGDGKLEPEPINNPGQ